MKYAALLLALSAVLLSTSCSRASHATVRPSPSATAPLLTGDDPEKAVRTYVDWKLRGYLGSADASALSGRIVRVEKLDSPSPGHLRFRVVVRFEPNPAASSTPVATGSTQSAVYDVSRDQGSQTWHVTIVSAQ